MTDSMSVAAGVKELAAYHRNGTVETIAVRALPVRKFDTYLKLIDDEPGTIELVTDKPPGWSDTLMPHSHAEIMMVSEELNGADFFAWLQRRVKRQEQLAPGSSGELGKRLLSASPTGSQSVPSAAV